MDIAIARTTDPWTSHAAAKEITESGIRESQREAVLRALQKSEGTTSSELAAISGIGRYTTARRLPELEKLGYVEKGPAKTCSVTSRKAMTWMISTDPKPVTVTFEQKLAALGFSSLDEYYADDWWINFKCGYYTRHPAVCFITGLTIDLHLHHITYVRLKGELDEDVVPLHKFWHKCVHHLVKTRKVKLEQAHLVVRDCYLATKHIEKKLILV